MTPVSYPYNAPPSAPKNRAIYSSVCFSCYVDSLHPTLYPRGIVLLLLLPVSVRFKPSAPLTSIILLIIFYKATKHFPLPAVQYNVNLMQK